MKPIKLSVVKPGNQKPERPSTIAASRKPVSSGVEARRQPQEQVLAASETRYRRLFESAQDGILVLVAGFGVFLVANPNVPNDFNLYCRDAWYTPALHVPCKGSQRLPPSSRHVPALFLHAQPALGPYDTCSRDKVLHRSFPRLYLRYVWVMNSEFLASLAPSRPHFPEHVNTMTNRIPPLVNTTGKYIINLARVATRGRDQFKLIYFSCTRMRTIPLKGIQGKYG
jgi:hypothetical protein